MQLILVCLALLLHSSFSKKKAKNFRVSSEISTGWSFCRNQALYYSDYLYKTTVINSGLFWKFIGEIPSSDKITDTTSDQQALLKQLHKHVKKNSELLRLLRVNAEMEFSAPRFEAIAHAQAELNFPECQTFIEYARNQFVCSVEELMSKELGAGNLKSDSFDYIYSVESKLPLIRLFTIPGAEGFKDIYEELKSFADDGSYSLVLQFVPKPATCPFYQAEVQPVGYGIEFEMKSAQYVVEEPVKEQEKPFEDEIKADKLLDSFAKIGKSDNLLAKALVALQKSKSIDSVTLLSQNLAWTSAQVAKTRVSEIFIEELKTVDPATAIYRVNGFDMAASTLDPFRMIQFMNLFYGRELELQELGYREGLLKKLFQSRYNPDYAEDSIEVAYAVNSAALVYLNDLERDKRYRGLSKSFSDYEKISKQPGRFLARNILTVVVPIEMTSSGAALLQELVQSINAGFPIRFAILPIVLTEADELIATKFYELQTQKGLRASTSYLTEALSRHGVNRQTESDSSHELAQEAKRLVKQFTIKDSSQIFANGHLVPLSQNLLQNLIQLYGKEAEWIVKKADEAEDDLYAFVLKEKRAFDLRNDLFTDPHLRYTADKYFTVADIRKLLSFKNYAFVDEEQAEHSLWVAGDFSKKEAFNLAVRALNQTLKTAELRSRIYCTSPMNSVPNRIIVAASGVLSETPESLDIVVQFLQVFYQHFFNGGFAHDSNLERLARTIQNNPVSKRILELANDLDSPVLKPILAENDRFFELYEADWFKATLIAINSNAWQLKGEECKSIAEDIEPFVERELTRRGARHAQLARDLGHTRIKDHLIVFGMAERKLMAQVDLDLSNMLTPSNKPFPEFDNSIVIGDRESSIFHIDALFNPFSREGQKFSSIMNYLAVTDMFSFRLSLITDPVADDPKQLKIYRFVTPDYKGVAIPIAPVGDDETLLALALDLPSAWMLVTEEANADLDNIRPTKVPHLKIRFRLKALLIEGQALFEDGKQVPAGKTVEAYDAETGFLADQSTVMANLGYFQLKAQPGRWKLRLIDEAFEYPLIEGGQVQISTFGGAFAHLEVEPKGIPLSKARVFGRQADINVFSLASGLFYERLLRIMITSVLKQTKKSTVKFWLLATTLSPQGREALEKMAAHYGFQYELMSYKWPFWLNPQSRKHRTIWAYKILFLDVLFPKSLKKIIFVDADQVVRTDLQELVDLDLKGHVYAMTPFCKDKPEMEEYRFWERNYWKNHLRGRPYHISALFVVDLEELRAKRVADMLRSQYQGLSRDPNSLANLDQDLPNNLQHLIPIYSLPQEWLWCETWCSEGTKRKAKTIDLCNNPKTFESKFDQAARIISEWKDYDEEIKVVLNELSQSEHDEL